MWEAHNTASSIQPPHHARLRTAVSASIFHSLNRAAALPGDQLCVLQCPPASDSRIPDSMRSRETIDALAPSRPAKPRIFRGQRQRRREDGLAGEKRGRMGESIMAGPHDACDRDGPLYMDRSTLCLPSFEDQAIVHGGDEGYQAVLKQYFPAAESHATERLVALKARLKPASTYDFWQILMEEMCDIFSAQCGYVAKRILVDVQEGPVEMPALGDPGSCLMGTAFYLNSGDVVKQLHRDYRYTAYGTPCAHMKHDKVFIIPERMSEVIIDNPNAAALPWDQSEAFIGVPLFAEGKCFAHFGMIWSTEGAAKLNVGWGYVEMFLHALEDMIQDRIVEGRSFVKDSCDLDAAQIVPLAAITPAQSLQPYARNLSHELRTPMQGVVGMLDIMYSTVLDAIANQPHEHTRAVFKDLKGHIEVVQESSKRAVEAADNVVHAYDMNMQMPDAPLTPEDVTFHVSSTEPPFFPTNDSSLDLKNIRSPGKRAHAHENLREGPSPKRSFPAKDGRGVPILDAESIVGELPVTVVSFTSEQTRDDALDGRLPSPALVSTSLHPLQQRVVTRVFLRGLVVDTIRNSRPTRLEHTLTELGEKFELQTIGSRDECQNRVIFLHVDVDVPEVVITDPQPLQFSLQKIIDNALKFTESGNISIRARVGDNDDKVEFLVADTGCGIDDEAKQRLFKPHFQQDASISRSRDGMGLSLFNAKAHVRKDLGGDITLERSATDGPAKGSEFLIRLPMSRSDCSDKTVVGTPPPSSHSSHRSFFADVNLSPHVHARPPLHDSHMSNVSSEHAFIPSKVDVALSRSTSRKRLNFNPQLANEFPLNILIAEDNAINRKVAVGSLVKLGYQKENITVAFDGREAVDHYQKSLDSPARSHFDLILMDIWMPNMDGYEATTKIKQMAAGVGKTITTIAVTADITSESRDRAKVVGMDGFLSKPYKVVDFEKLIIEHFSKMDVDG